VRRDHTIGPKTVKSGENYSAAPKSNMKRSAVATWCNDEICRLRGGLVHHIIIIPAALSLPLLRGAAGGRAPTIFH